jgi:hypothetical protein
MAGLDYAAGRKRQLLQHFHIRLITPLPAVPVGGQAKPELQNRVYGLLNDRSGLKTLILKFWIPEQETNQ